MDPVSSREDLNQPDKMTIYYLTIINNEQLGRKDTYLNETIEGAQAAIVAHVKDELEIDAEEEIKKHMVKMATHRRVEFTVTDNDDNYECECFIECRTIQLDR
jgi:hypothetical protein